VAKVTRSGFEAVASSQLVDLAWVLPENLHNQHHSLLALAFFVPWLSYAAVPLEVIDSARPIQNHLLVSAIECHCRVFS
jgi:hypothetical protein